VRATSLELIAAWRDAARPVVFVRHDSREQGSPLSPDSRGNAFKEVITGEPDLLVAKSVHSAFLGSPDLAAWLREQECDSIAVCGITTSHCCETTARAGSDMVSTSSSCWTPRTPSTLAA
jgi:nicotinamidase-related amidase